MKTLFNTQIWKIALCIIAAMFTMVADTALAANPLKKAWS